MNRTIVFIKIAALPRRGWEATFETLQWEDRETSNNTALVRLLPGGQLGLAGSAPGWRRGGRAALIQLPLPSPVDLRFPLTLEAETRGSKGLSCSSQSSGAILSELKSQSAIS